MQDDPVRKHYRIDMGVLLGCAHVVEAIGLSIEEVRGFSEFLQKVKKCGNVPSDFQRGDG